MHPLIESDRLKIRALAERHGFQDVRVFGSMVRGYVNERSEVAHEYVLRRPLTGWCHGQAPLVPSQAVLY